MRKSLAVACLICLVGLFFGLDLGRWLTLESLKASRGAIAAAAAAHPAAALGVYAMVYLVVVTLNLPGAAVLGLAAGAVFGFWTGTATVSVLSTVGAALSCALSRFLLRDWVRSRFGPRLAAIDEGVRREGAYYLFGLRLIPAVPFFLINLGMGLTPMPLRTYALVSWIGMLPGTMVFVNAGCELARVDSLGHVLSPGLMLSLALFGVLPLTARKLLPRFRPKISPAPQQRGGL
jgi:uncharacterized membrane protein YdjX (TVP38/TMEM64 family)